MIKSLAWLGVGHARLPHWNTDTMTAMKTTIATSIKYGNYKQYQAATNQIIATLRSLWKEFNEAFDYRADVTVHIRPIRGGTHGRAFDHKNMIEIDPRYPIKRVVETIAHELTHSEQYKQNRLSYDAVSQCRVFDGTRFRKPTTHQQYLNLPWEVEARKRAAEFVARCEQKGLI